MNVNQSAPACRSPSVVSPPGANTAGRRPGRRPSGPGSEGWPTPAGRSARLRRRPTCSGEILFAELGDPDRDLERSGGEGRGVWPRRRRDGDSKRHSRAWRIDQSTSGSPQVRLFFKLESTAARGSSAADASFDRQIRRDPAGIFERDQDRPQPGRRWGGHRHHDGGTWLEEKLLVRQLRACVAGIIRAPGDTGQANADDQRGHDLREQLLAHR